MRRRVPLLAVVCATAALAVFAAPFTRWVAVAEVRALVGMADPLGTARDVSGLLESGSPESRGPTAARPGDPFLLQLAAAFASDPAERLFRLEALAQRFPDRPSVRAHILRYAAADGGLGRPESVLFTGRERAPTERVAPRATMLRVERQAAAGERLDPDNAYFPYMRALSLLALRQDAAAGAAVRRAGSRPRWSDYALEEPDARRAAAGRSGGTLAATRRMVLEIGTLFPHYARMRDGARVVTQLAANVEAAGRPREGIALRHALMRYGSLMRAQSPSLVGTLVGIAVTSVATGRPGNAAVRARPPDVPSDEWAARRLAAYVAFARKHAGPTEAEWVQAEMERVSRVRGGVRSDLDRSPYAPATLIGLAALWVAGGIALGFAAWFLGAGLLARALSRARAAGCGYAAGIAALTALLVWATSRWALEVADIGTALSMVDPGEGSPSAARWVAAGIAAVVACLPLPVLGAAALVARARRRPWLPSVGGASVTAGLVCLLLFAGLVTATAAREAGVTRDIDRYRAHEGRYLFARTGQPWPDAAPLRVTRPD